MLSLTAIRLRTVAREAARARNWIAAADAYRGYLDRQPDDARCWVQLGHALKETGDMEAAVTAYSRALDAAPQAAEIWFHLSHACRRMGDRATAIDCCAHAAMLDPTFTKATGELIALGARDRIPSGVSGDGVLVVERPDDHGVPDLPSAPTVYAPSRYDTFRHQIVIAAPPSGSPAAGPATIVIDARTALPIEVRATLSSLLDQVDDRWRAIVHAPPALRDHSVASIAAIDPRIRFVATDTPLPGIDDAPNVMLTGAGTVLDRQAISWFSYAMARTGSVAAYTDHDHCVDDWRTGRTYMRPAFQTMFDPEWIPEPEDGPAAIFVDRTRLLLAGWRQDDAWRVIRDAASIGPVAHLPLLLASRKALPAQAEQALSDPPEADDQHGPAVLPAKPVRLPAQRIQVIIQTRDQPAMLRAAVASIRRRAARSDLLDILVVDNRSMEAATGRVLDGWQRRKTASVLTLDEPFNWSRANNLAVGTGTAPLLLFLNNDTEMLTAGWDDTLRDTLAVRDVGIVGATLLYPDRTIQHAGIVMGMGSGGPIHEGVGRPVDAGPGDRWRKPRSAAAVTGAFLAMRRDVFTAVEGFDAINFAIAFNDIDLCLRVRAMGLRVVMASGITVIHHESKTRGINVTRSQVAWDLDELGRMHDRWGTALFDDPAYNPHWTRSGQPFDGYRVPPMREVLRHIDLAARPAPWTPVIARDEPAWW